MNIIFNQLPDHLETFEQMLQEYPLNVPEHTCALFLCALHLYITDRKEGEMAVDQLRGPRMMNGFERSFLKDRLRGKEYLPNAYFCSPDNHYQPSFPYTIEVKEDPHPEYAEEGFIRKYLSTAGADAPRPMKLRKKQSTGEWFLWEYSSILSGIRSPASEEPWL